MGDVLRRMNSALQLSRERFHKSDAVGSIQVLLCKGPEAEQEGRKNPDLSEDLIIKILAKLPVKSLNRFKSVSKHWYNLILSPYFIAIYSEINPKKKLISAYCCSVRPKKTILPPATTTTISFKFNDVPMELTIPLKVKKLKIVGCSEGIVCLSLTEEEDRFVLWNPAVSGQFRVIGPMIDRPPSSKAIHNDLCASGFFFDPIAKTFKVVRVVFLYNNKKWDQKENTAQVSVFSLSDNSWRYTKICIPFQLWGRSGGSITRAVCVNRCMYWVIGLYFHDERTRDEAFFLCFDMVDESFKKMKMPSCDKKACLRISPHKESLALIVHHHVIMVKEGQLGTLYDIWVMNDSCSNNDERSWRKLLTISPPMITECEFGFLSKDGVDWITIEKFQEKEHFLYNPKTRETKKISGKDDEFQSFSYSEILVSSLLMASKRHYL